MSEEIEELAATINETLQRIGTRWIEARGLVAEIDETRHVDGVEMCSAPGHMLCLERTRALTNEAISRFDDIEHIDTVHDAKSALDEIQQMEVEAVQQVKKLAQLLIGVNSFHGDPRRYILPDRIGGQILSDSRWDGFCRTDQTDSLDSRDEEGRCVELAGLYGRLIVEHTWAIIETETGRHHFSYDRGLLCHQDPAGNVETWPDPVNLREMAQRTVKVLGVISAVTVGGCE